MSLANLNSLAARANETVLPVETRERRSMRIVIESIPHAQQRYPTLGDWWREGDTVHIRVSATGDDKQELLIALHELVEWALCEKRGIAEDIVTAFDLQHLSGEWSDDPGWHPQAPYHREHVFAECIERLVAAELGIEWPEYDKRLREIGA